MNATFRQFFPVLQRTHKGLPLIFMDGPAGTQVPQPVIDAISDYYKMSNANTHGAFLTSLETDDLIEGTREAVAQFLGAEGGHCISLGQNMTTLNFSLSRAIGRMLQPGDEILITQLDHEGNRGPWLALRERGVIVREVKLLPSGVLDYEDLAAQLNQRTRLVAMGMASNILGTVNDVAKVRALTYQYGAWLLLDAVHYAPHFAIDVQALDCDFLLCSAYKFYGPHVGLLYSRPGLLDRLQPDRLRTAYQQAPYSIETGTQNHAAFAGVRAAIEFIADLGQGNTLRDRIIQAMGIIRRHESVLASQLAKGLLQLPGVQVLGPSLDTPFRSPTLAVTVEGLRPDEVCLQLADHNIFAWDGHFYALRATEVLGLVAGGGVTRLGISAYTTSEEVEKVVEVFEGLV